MGPSIQLDLPDLTGQTCITQVGSETHGRYGSNCDQIECGGSSAAVCEFENCSNLPCEFHTGHCPACLKPYCTSRDRMLHTCLVEHQSAGKCAGQLVSTPLRRLGTALDSEEYSELKRFVRHNSDGLGNPLPNEVCDNLGLAVVYLSDSLPDHDKAALLDSRWRRLSSRNERQRFRRAVKRQSAVAVSLARAGPIRLEPFKRSTVHLVTGALTLQCWTGSWHYQQQMEILRIMGFYRADDFIRDRVDYLRRSNQGLFERVAAYARALKSMKPENSRFLTQDLSL
jgi:hypothetical protein